MRRTYLGQCPGGKRGDDALGILWGCFGIIVRHTAPRTSRKKKPMIVGIVAKGVPARLLYETFGAAAAFLSQASIVCQASQSHVGMRAGPVVQRTFFLTQVH